VVDAVRTTIKGDSLSLWLLLNFREEPTGVELAETTETLNGLHTNNIMGATGEILSMPNVSKVGVFHRKHTKWKELQKFEFTAGEILSQIGQSRPNWRREKMVNPILIEPFLFEEFSLYSSECRQTFEQAVKKEARDFLLRGLDGRRPLCELGKGRSCFFVESKYSEKINCTTCYRMTSKAEIIKAFFSKAKRIDEPSYIDFVRSRLRKS
jgi:hypothetical protein